MTKTFKDFDNLIIIIMTLLALAVAITQVFSLRLFGYMMMGNTYMYLLIAIFLSLVFIIFPSVDRPNYSQTFWYWVDRALFVITLVLGMLFAVNGLAIINEGWAVLPPKRFIIFSILIWLISLEGARRSGGWVLAAVAGFFSFFPLFTGSLPGFLQGNQFNLFDTATYHAMSTESILGIPLAVFSKLLIGYMIFGVALIVTGGGDFFLNLAYSLLGRRRGGPAKVAVLASAFFGSMSGSAISNVITTGSITIPAMKKSGYPPHFAAAVESCASTGGVMTPPIMGATAFIMASFLNLPYLTIAIAASIPAILYYGGLLIQVDAHAALHNLKGLAKEDIPLLRTVFREGWYYLFTLVLLIFFLVLRLEARAPFFAIIFLFLVTNIRAASRLTFSKLVEFILRCGRLLTELVGILAAVGLIVGSLAMTGLGHSFSRELVVLAGDNIYLLLLLGAITSFILGMGMTVSACYIFLAIVLAPGLVQAGMNELAVHLFVAYCGMLSYITPPVGLAVYPAAAIAGSPPMQTGVTAVRLGAVTFIIPLFFVLNPALILQGSVLNILWSVSTAIVGVFLLASGLGGYVIGFGPARFSIRSPKWLNILLQIALFFAGLFLAFPEGRTDIIGFVLGAILVAIIWFGAKAKTQATNV